MFITVGGGHTRRVSEIRDETLDHFYFRKSNSKHTCFSNNDQQVNTNICIKKIFKYVCNDFPVSVSLREIFEISLIL